MKRGILPILLIILLITSFALITAQEDDDPDDNLDIAGKAGELGKETEQKFEEFLVPSQLQKPTKWFFKVKEDKDLTMSKFVVLIAICILLFLTIKTILEMFPVKIFKKGLTTILGSIIIISIISITGMINQISDFIFNLAETFKFLNKWSPLKFIFALIVLILVYVIAFFFIKYFKNKLILSQAEQTGTKAGAGIKLAEKTFDTATEES